MIATDLSSQRFEFPCSYEQLDITQHNQYEEMVKENKIDYIVHLAGILSALGEREPDMAIDVNVFGALNALKIARDHTCQVFIPSTIGVFGGEKFEKD